jgi:hypothetical protein
MGTSLDALPMSGVKGCRVQAGEAWDSLSLVEVRHSSCISGADRSASRKAVGNAGLCQ